MFQYILEGSRKIIGLIGIFMNIIVDENQYSEVSMKLEVPYICQNPGFPTGCESVSAVMVLQYYNNDISVDEFVDNYLNSRGCYQDEENNLHGPAPWEYFVGSPREKWSFGCYAPVIEDAVTRINGENGVENTTGYELDELCSQYIDKGKPVLVWASMGMKPTKEGRSWWLESGEQFTWISGEHCLVLTGYDEEYYYFNDPLVGQNIPYKKEVVRERYQELGMQSLVVQ